jgi:anti-sigma-K factor RskA
MSDEAELGGDDLLAAELALGLLEGDELAEARRREAEDSAFARAVDAWNERFAPMLDAIPSEQPRADLWDRISARLQTRDSNVVSIEPIRRRANIWRAYSLGVTALAASLAFVLAFDVMNDSPAVQPPPAASASEPTLVATLTAEDGPSRLVISYDRPSETLLVAPAELTGAAGHEHELWLLPPSGNPRSLGIVRLGAPQRLRVPAELAAALRTDASLAVSVEPTGGSPTGLPTGPVIASGPLQKI